MLIRLPEPLINYQLAVVPNPTIQ